MRLLIAALLSALLLSHLHGPPVNKQSVHTASTPAVTVAVKTTTPTKDVQAQPEIKTASVVTPVPDPVPTTHEQLMAAAGISPEDYGAVDYIVSHESNWDENATEPTTGAHGLPQALPYSKTGCGWSDAVCQLSWANTYAESRYGGWWSAQAYWVANRNW